MDDRAELLKRIERLEALLAERDARIAELEQLLKKQGKTYKPRANRKPKDPPEVDHRTVEHRKHPGSFRQPPKEEDVSQEHECTLARCPHCGDERLTPTGKFEDQLVEDIPPPKVKVHRYRRHEYHCAGFQKTSLGRGDLDVAGAHVGPRARWLVSFARADLGISLAKTCRMLEEWFGLKLSRAGALGHLKWSSRLCHPVVQKLLALLRQAEVVHADETGWRINGKNVWAWCFANPKIAVFLIEQHVSRDNNLGERDIRSVAPTRADGGVNRAAWGATAFANIKSVVRTCQKNGLRFVDYALNLVRATLAKTDPPFPLSPKHRLATDDRLLFP